MTDTGIGEALARDFADLTELGRMTHISLRLIFAAALGGLLGYQRTAYGKAAGLRTHMLVSVGAAFFILVPDLEGMEVGDLSRVVQGVITGIGFLGAGTILKQEQRVTGLTTAAGIWFAAAVGVAVGFGRVGSAVLGTLLAFLILGLIGRLERNIGKVTEGK